MMNRSKKVLVVALVLIVLGSFCASMFNTSMFQVKVKKIDFETEHGTLSGLLYMPKGAGADDPRPVIVTTHGYLNSKEMQDAPAIEMSRRGYIVLALDMYDHGDSRWKGDIPVGSQFGTFWIYSQYDAANYVAKQDYTKKDEKGNAYLAVSGHSMGGFSTLVALYMDEMASLQTGTRSIYAGISVGADYSYASAVASETDYIAAFGNRTVGMIAGHYDEFFFNKSEEEKTASEKKVTGTVTYKDFAATASGKQFLGLTSEDTAKSEQFYTVESGELLYEGNVVRESQTGQHIIYTPNQTHPWNHFSKNTTADLIDFYTTAFDGVTSVNQANVTLNSENQIWFLKELSNLIAMIGFFLLLIPVVEMLLKAPFFKKAITEEIPMLSPEKTKLQKIASWVSIIACMLYPGILFATLMDKEKTGLMVLAGIAGISVVAGAILAIVKKEKAGVLAAVISLITALVFLFADKILPLSPFFNEPTTNQIIYWAIGNGLIALIVAIFFYGITKKKDGTTWSAYGVSGKVKSILASFCIAILSMIILYAVLFLIQAVFGTDFRFWTMAVRTFKPEFVVVWLRYLPFFFVYYFINAIAINANTRGKKGGYAIAIGLNVGGLILWLLCQYGMVFTTGTAMLPAQSLNGILLFATIPCLAIAAVYAKKLFEKTHNVWLAAFINTMLFTMITVANTVMFWNMINA